MHNPYVLLRALVLLDIAMCFFGVGIPTFREYSLIDLVAALNNLSGSDKVVHVLWLVNFTVMIVAWVGLLCVKNWARYVYIFPLLLIVTMSFIKGNTGFSFGIFAVMADLIAFYYGFVVAMLFFSPISTLFPGKSA